MWKQIPGFSNYEVNERGEVRTWRKKVRRWRDADLSGRRTEPLPIHGTVTPRGYRVLVLRFPDGRRKNVLRHRAVAMAFLPNPDNLPDVAHLNGRAGDDRLDNLAWSSHRNNQMMMQDHGTQAVKRKLSAEDVAYIREAVAKGPRGTARRMAEKFDVHPPQITRIVKRQRWARDWN